MEVEWEYLELKEGDLIILGKDVLYGSFRYVVANVGMTAPRLSFTPKWSGSGTKVQVTRQTLLEIKAHNLGTIFTFLLYQQ